jgi:hypothetical protein
MDYDRRVTTREAGERARFACIQGARRASPEGQVLTALVEKSNAMAADVRRRERAQKCRLFAGELRTLLERVEREVDLDATKLRAYALHLENRAEMFEGKPL